MAEREQSEKGWTYNCLACGARLESQPGETFAEFSDRVFDEHTIKHIEAGDTPPRSLGEALTNLLDLASRGVLEP